MKKASLVVLVVSIVINSLLSGYVIWKSSAEHYFEIPITRIHVVDYYESKSACLADWFKESLCTPGLPTTGPQSISQQKSGLWRGPWYYHGDRSYQGPGDKQIPSTNHSFTKVNVLPPEEV